MTKNVLYFRSGYTMQVLKLRSASTYKQDWPDLIQAFYSKQISRCQQKGAVGHLQLLLTTCVNEEVTACLASPTSLAGERSPARWPAGQPQS